MPATILIGDVFDRLREMPDESVHCVVTSPPYWGLRDYGVDGQIGLEPTPCLFVDSMVQVFREVRRVLRSDGTCWINLGDSYAGGGRGGYTGDASTLDGGVEGQDGSRAAKMIQSRRRDDHPIPRSDVAVDGLKSKDLCGMPWRVAFALQADGWWLRQDIIWHKPNPMPESVSDRCTKSHEYLFLMTKSARYHYDADAIREPDAGTDHPRSILHQPEPSGGIAPPNSGIRRADGRNGEGRNKRSVWTIATQPFSGAHFATFPEKLVEPCIRAGCPDGGVVLDPFAGSGTTLLVARKLGRDAIGIELNAEYAAMAEKRIGSYAPLFADA